MFQSEIILFFVLFFGYFTLFKILMKTPDDYHIKKTIKCIDPHHCMKDHKFITYDNSSFLGYLNKGLNIPCSNCFDIKDKLYFENNNDLNYYKEREYIKFKGYDHLRPEKNNCQKINRIEII